MINEKVKINILLLVNEEIENTNRWLNIYNLYNYLILKYNEINMIVKNRVM